jgi:anhydro-N-acetylmuramic acid kinase
MSLTDHKKQLYIGLMSGTSADGIDLALVDFSSKKAMLVASDYYPYSSGIRQKIIRLYCPDINEIDRAQSLDKELAVLFARAINTFLVSQHLLPSDIIAIGNHGQTIRHRPLVSPETEQPFTLQIGCNQTLAVLTSIPTIGDFRTKDIALGGQGAPLVPAFHRALLSHLTEDTFIVNIGGIANLTYLPINSNSSVLGFDTGPGNALMDAWCYQHTGKRYDDQGNWAAKGVVDQPLLQKLLTDNYFSLAAPKSTGREYFTLAWLAPFLTDKIRQPVDVQATLTALTACSIALHIKQISSGAAVFLCGGGIANNLCYKQLEHQLSSFSLHTIKSLGLNNAAFEAMAFAWLAFAYEKKIYGNIPEVTGAKRSTVLGSAFYP